MSPRISDLPTPRNLKNDLRIVMADATKHENVQLDMQGMVELLWDNMYIHSRKVIIGCPYCNAANVITNPTCVKCGGPLGEVK